MFLRSVNRRNKLLKALLLVSFLPSILFNIFSEGLHNHPLFPSLPEQASLSRPAIFSEASLCDKENDKHCLVCQWALSSLACASLSLDSSPDVIADELTAAEIAVFQISARFCSIRAPPLS